MIFPKGGSALTEQVPKNPENEAAQVPKNALYGEFPSVLPESPQNGAVVVDTPDDNTVARSRETVNQWLEEIKRPLKF